MPNVKVDANGTHRKNTTNKFAVICKVAQARCC